jgi:integrase
MKPSQRAPLEHPLAARFARALEVVSAPLSPGTERVYRGTVRNFLLFLADGYPEVRSLKALRRDPHVLAWLAYLRSQNPPLAATTYIMRILLLRALLQELAWTHKLPELAYLLRREDVPRAPQRKPRPLTAEQDQVLHQELLRRNDLGANVFLLLRHTGMRIGEAVDLAFDCLHAAGPQQWAILVPLGKMKTERMVPVDASVCALVQRLRFFRSFDPAPADGFLLARTPSRHTFIRKLRQYLHEVCADAGLSTGIVPHQLRHTYATEMARAGVSLPAVMKLLGHRSPDMTMLYLDIAITDLGREFQRARLEPRYLVPRPTSPEIPPRAGLEGVIDSLLYAQHAVEMFRRDQAQGPLRSNLDRVANRLCKLLALTRKFATPEE